MNNINLARDNIFKFINKPLPALGILSLLFTLIGIKFHIAVRYGEEYIKCGDEDVINGCGEIISGKKEVPKTYISGIILPVISIEIFFSPLCFVKNY